MPSFPPPVINVRPPGLLSLLGLQNGGQMPDQLGATTQPTFELSDWYLRAGIIVRSTVTTNVINAGLSNIYDALKFSDGALETVQVPNGEWWYIHNWSHALDVGLGSTVANMKFIAVWDPVNATRRTVPGIPLPIFTQPAGTRHDYGCGGFWLGPGTVLNLGFGAITFAAAIANLGTLVYTPVRV